MRLIYRTTHLQRNKKEVERKNRTFKCVVWRWPMLQINIYFLLYHPKVLEQSKFISGLRADNAYYLGFFQCGVFRSTLSARDLRTKFRCESMSQPYFFVADCLVCIQRGTDHMYLYVGISTQTTNLNIGLGILFAKTNYRPRLTQVMCENADYVIVVQKCSHPFSSCLLIDERGERRGAFRWDFFTSFILKINTFWML